jgi:bifunctional non-homologous end joining protein LigD
VRDRLAAIGLESWPKSSGGKGLHVVVPLVPELGWDALKAFARAIADSLVEEHPELYVSKASKAARTGRVFIDYLRNGRGATSIAAFSPRARAGAPVAVPLRWSDVGRAVAPRYSVADLPGAHGAPAARSLGDLLETAAIAAPHRRDHGVAPGSHAIAG